ncbi:hypothetical protein [Photorhabdus africana]|nr:hypothetical protein [Photorhabdus sp. CRI-LC]
MSAITVNDRNNGKDILRMYSGVAGDNPFFVNKEPITIPAE